MTMKVKQLVAGVLTTVVMLGQLLPGLSTVLRKKQTLLQALSSTKRGFGLLKFIKTT